MRRRSLPVLLTLLAGVFATAGCDSFERDDDDAKYEDSPLVGTWRGRETNEQTPFQFASITFAPDGTYTAQMKYNGNTVADSGGWQLAGDTLTVGGEDASKRRTYTVKPQGDELAVTDPQSKMTVTLDRLK